MRIQDRYATAVKSSCLTVDERTTFSDTDVLGAFGLASLHYELAVALTRLFTGDNTAGERVVRVLAEMLRDKAKGMRLRMSQVLSEDMARACLGWHREGTCKPCGGHGKQLIPGTKTHSERDCLSCRGLGKRPFESQFHPERRELARWLVAQMEREQAKAGAEAMKKLAPTLDL